MAYRMRNSTRQFKSNKLKIALMFQSYDPWDIGFFMKRVWRSCLKWGEAHYGFRFDLVVLYEDDIISGKLEREGFDVLIGPGGSGTWHAKEEFRERIRNYITSGGNYLGVCGDGSFGTLGFANLSPRLEKVFINQVGRVLRLEPFLGVVNVYTDLSAMEKISNWKIRSLFFRILFSPVNFYFTKTVISTLKPYAGKTLKANWAFMIATPGTDDKERVSPVNVDIVYADDWVFPKGSLKGKAAQVSSTYGKGRVILTGLHAELRRRTYDIVIRNILWLADLEEKALPCITQEVKTCSN
jgi:glutamine amidotransferase-like uncharacterized protein